MGCRDYANHNIQVCDPDDSVSACAERIRREDLPMLFVVSPEKKLLGMLTREAVLAATWLHKGRTARDLMSTVLVECGPEERPDTVAALLIRSGAAAVCIVEDGELLGWIAPHDLAQVSRPAWSGSKPKCSIR